VLFYRAAVDLSRSTLTYVTGIVRRHRKAIGSAWRLLTPGRQALLVLVHLRKGETFAEAGAGFGMSASTAWRYVEEVTALLSARSPKLPQALAEAKKDGLTHLILDGTLIYTDRVRADRPYYSGKHRARGMNKPESQKQASRSHAKLCGPGERANAQINMEAPPQAAVQPSKAGHLVKAVAVLQNYELTRG
jgi:hypothetical protein